MKIVRGNAWRTTWLAAAMLLPGPVASAGLVDIELAPRTQTVDVCDIVEIDLLVSTSDEAGQAFAGMDVILIWDPTYLELIGVDQSGAGTPLFVSAFLNDPDDINDDLTDGDALYTALAPPGNPAIAPGQPDTLVVTTFQFRAITASGGPTTLSMLDSLGTFAMTQVLLSGDDFTGDTSSTTDVTVGTCPPDIDVDGIVAFPDLLQVLSFWGPCSSCCPQDIDNNGDVGFSDLLLVLSFWGPC